MPQISVIVPVYKVEKYIHRCVDSILGQTFTDFELILVDDGSPDNCGAICDEYAAKDSRIHVIHQANGGLSAARNAGIDWAFANSDSEWLTFVDSDDYLYHEYLERMYDAVITTGTRICTCNATQSTFSDDPAAYVPAVYATEAAYCDQRILRHRIAAWCKLYHKDLWTDIRYPVGRLFEDCFTTHRILFQVPEFAAIIAPMYYVTANSEGISSSNWTPRKLDKVDGAEEMLSFFRDNRQAMAECRTARTVIYTIAGMIGEIRNSRESEENKRGHITALQKKLRYYVRQYKRELKINIRDYRQIYETAYPVRTRMFDYGQAVLRKLHICNYYTKH